MTYSGPDPYPVPSGRRIHGEAAVPPSKSIAHRALILAAMAEGASLVSPLPEADDVAATRDCLRTLGVRVTPEAGGARVEGVPAGWKPPHGVLRCRASGTTLRLLAGVCGAQEGTFTLDGDAQLRRRPMADLARPLSALGVCLRYAERPGHPPLVVEGRRWAGGTVEVAGSTSSQFLSGLLLGAPRAAAPVAFVARELVSRPYAWMTAELMARFGAKVHRPDAATWSVTPAAYRACDVSVEPDTSAAAFLWAAAAVTDGDVLVKGTAEDSLQGDAVFPDLLARMGCRVVRTPEGVRVAGRPGMGLEADVQETPDLVPALVATACFAPTPSRLAGVGHLRFKESDRLSVLADAVAALGGTILLEDDCLTVVPGEDHHGAILDPHGDHRMAMAFAVMGSVIPGVRITEPSCVAKSFPGFFETLQELCR